MQETVPEPAQKLDSQPVAGEASTADATAVSTAGSAQRPAQRAKGLETDLEAAALEPASEPDPQPNRQQAAEPEPELKPKKTKKKAKTRARTNKKKTEKRAAKPERARVRVREPEPGAAKPASLARRSKRTAARAYELPEELAARPLGRRSLRVVSANLRNGQVDPEGFAELVTAMQADIVAIQEAGRAHFEALVAEFPHGEFETGPANSGLGIALRRPATPGRIELVWRSARQMTLDPSDWPELQRPLDVVNVHIAPPHLYKPPLYGFVVRNQQVRALEDHFGSPPQDDPASQSRATVLIGDFNATPLWPVYRRIASQFTDAAIAVAQVFGRSTEPTWSLPANTRRRLRLDHAFVRGVTPEEFQAVRVAGSDHSAIVVDITDRTNHSSSSSRDRDRDR